MGPVSGPLSPVATHTGVAGSWEPEMTACDMAGQRAGYPQDRSRTSPFPLSETMSETMDDKAKYTERDVVLRERAAYMAGAAANEGYHREGWAVCKHTVADSCGRIDAARRYPLPKVTRPRVVADPHTIFDGVWRCVDGELEYRSKLHRMDWTRHSSGHPITPQRVAVWADLLANPTEEVESES